MMFIIAHILLTLLKWYTVLILLAQALGILLFSSVNECLVGSTRTTVAILSTTILLLLLLPI